MKGPGQWDSYTVRRATKRSSQLKTQKMILKRLSRGKSLLSKRELTSGSGESAAVHIGDEDPAVAKTVETLTVAGSDEPARRQEKEARSVGGIPSQ
ncbi:MAG: hypothetical protein P1Q69_16495 [Candidatus Thorarchaeota archaeon]|nr:hypothetical protein [Candidatus Thorarchaeota archaeon]